MLLGSARYLAETRNFAGTVNFIFEPAEEGIGGAKAMLQDGLFERFPCDSVFGCTIAPTCRLETSLFAPALQAVVSREVASGNRHCRLCESAESGQLFLRFEYNF
jgi:hippurate hydrolase